MFTGYHLITHFPHGIVWLYSGCVFPRCIAVTTGGHWGLSLWIRGCSSQGSQLGQNVIHLVAPEYVTYSKIITVIPKTQCCSLTSNSNKSHLSIVEWVGPLLEDTNIKMASAKVHGSISISDHRSLRIEWINLVRYIINKIRNCIVSTSCHRRLSTLVPLNCSIQRITFTLPPSTAKAPACSSSIHQSPTNRLQENIRKPAINIVWS